jgi:hypothetical protein
MFWIAAHAKNTYGVRGVSLRLDVTGVDPLLAKLVAERGPGSEVAGHAVDATTRWRR